MKKLLLCLLLSMILMLAACGEETDEKDSKNSDKEPQKESVEVEVLIESETTEYSDGTYKKVEYTYDEKGNLIKTETFDKNEENIGWEKYEYNADKQVTKIDDFYLYEDGSSMSHSYERKYKDGRLESETCIMNGSPMYINTYETYDEKGNVLKVTNKNLWITNSELSSISSGVSYKIYEYDSENRVVKEADYDEFGKETYVITREYFDKGYTELEIQNEEEKKTFTESTYNEDGFLTKQVIKDDNNNEIESPAVYSYKSTYDKYGNLIHTIIYDKDEKEYGTRTCTYIYK